jgi:hypothetical protein
MAVAAAAATAQRQRAAVQQGTQADQPNRGHFARSDAQYRWIDPSITFGWLA